MVNESVQLKRITDGGRWQSHQPLGDFCDFFEKKNRHLNAIWIKLRPVLVNAYWKNLITNSSVRRIFERGGGGGGGGKRVARNWERKIKTRAKFLTGEDEDQKKRVFTQIQSVFPPRFRRRPQTKRVFTQIYSAQIFCPNSKGGGHGLILCTILR